MKKTLLLSCIVLLLSIVAVAQKSAVFVTGGTAIHGYDPVAYFTESKAVKGDSLFSCTFEGVAWRFANQQNLDAFKANPQKYMPQYGGYCAYGMADGHKAPTDPEAWKIADGKLYLNYNKNVQQLWFKKQAEFIQTANINWPQLKDKE